MSIFQIGNGCDLWFNGSWESCCEIHDKAFQNGTDLLGFFSANINLGTCVWQHSPLNAIVMVPVCMVFGIFVYRFKFLNGKTLFQIITTRKYGND